MKVGVENCLILQTLWSKGFLGSFKKAIHCFLRFLPLLFGYNYYSNISSLDFNLVGLTTVFLIYRNC